MTNLLQRQIEKGLEYCDLLLDLKYYKKHFWKHSFLYELARNYLGLEDKKFREKNKLWKKFLTSPETVDSKDYIKLKKYMEEHNHVIHEFLKEINKKSEDSPFSENQVFRRTRNIAPFGVYD